MNLQEIKEELARFVDWYAEDKQTNTDLQSKINKVFDYIATKEIETAEKISEVEKENADLQQRLDWAQGFLDKDVEYDELSKLRKENAELKMKLLTLENKEQIITTTVSN